MNCTKKWIVQKQFSWSQNNYKYNKSFLTKNRKWSKDKDRIIRDIKNFFEQQEDHYKTVRAYNIYSNSYIKYESNSDRNKALSITEYLDEIKQCLKDSINNLKKSDTWKIQLTIATNVISSKDNNEKREMNSKSDDIEIMKIFSKKSFYLS